MGISTTQVERSIYVLVSSLWMVCPYSRQCLYRDITYKIKCPAYNYPPFFSYLQYYLTKHCMMSHLFALFLTKNRFCPAIIHIMTMMSKYGNVGLNVEPKTNKLCCLKQQRSD